LQSRDHASAVPPLAVRGPLVVCIVLSYGSAEDTFECLESLQRSSYKHLRILLLDGDLSDDAAVRIRESFPTVRVLKLTDNRGYAGNNNVGVRAALQGGAEWVLLLNNDTVIDDQCITTMVEAVTDHDASVAGPMIYHHDEPDTIQSAGGTLSVFWRDRHLGQNETEQQQYPNTRTVDWVSGCAFMISRPAIELVGPLDERYFMYGEEIEWCLRVRKAGGVVVHVPAAKVWHKGVRRNYEPSPAVTYYSTRNLLLTLWIHRAPGIARLVRSLYIIRLLATWTLRPKWRRSKADHRDAVWWGAVDYLRGRWGPMTH